MSISTIQGAQASFWTRHLPRRLDIIFTCEYKYQRIDSTATFSRLSHCC
jgi:hypothetical protein